MRKGSPVGRAWSTRRRTPDAPRSDEKTRDTKVRTYKGATEADGAQGVWGDVDDRGVSIGSVERSGVYAVRDTHDADSHHVERRPCAETG